MKCEKCEKVATRKISVKTSGRGRFSRNHFVCEDDIEQAKAEIAGEIKGIEIILGNPFYPRVSRLIWGQIAVTVI